MWFLPVSVGSAVVVGATASLTAVAASGDLAQGVDIWTLVEKGGAPMAVVLFLFLTILARQLALAQNKIEAKDAIILEMAKRQVSATETSNGIANDQMKCAVDTHKLLKELVTLLRGKLDIG